MYEFSKAQVENHSIKGLLRYNPNSKYPHTHWLKQGNPHLIMAKHLTILSLLLFTDFAPFI